MSRDDPRHHTGWLVGGLPTKLPLPGTSRRPRSRFSTLLTQIFHMVVDATTDGFPLVRPSDEIFGTHTLGIGQSRCRSFAFEGIKQVLPVGDSEFGEGRVEVALDRPNRHRKLSGDLRVALPGRRQHGGLTLTSR